MMVVIHPKSLNLASISHPLLFSSKPMSTKSRPLPIASSSSSSSSAQHEEGEKRKIEVRVCTNRTCRRQASVETLQVLSGIAPPDVSVTACGCLGKCGAGPNVFVLPDAVLIKHCGTPARASQLMSFLCLAPDDSSKCLEALALRNTAQDEMDKGNYSDAYRLLSQAIDLKPFGGVHISYKNRSIARLAMGDLAEALLDANEALKIAPKYSEAYISQGDAFMAMEQIDAAEKSYSAAIDLDPSILQSKSFLIRIAKLKEKLTPAI